MWLCVTKYAQDDSLIRAQLIQIRRNASSESMPAIPLQPDCFSRMGNSPWTVSFASRNDANTRNPHCAWMISETPTLSSRTRHTSTKKRSSCCVGAFTMYSPSGADGSANTKQGCNRSCATATETRGKAGDGAVSPPNLLATVNQFGRANLGSLPNADHPTRMRNFVVANCVP